MESQDTKSLTRARYFLFSPGENDNVGGYYTLQVDVKNNTEHDSERDGRYDMALKKVTSKRMKPLWKLKL